MAGILLSLLGFGIVIGLMSVSIKLHKTKKERYRMFTQDKPNTTVVKTLKPHRYLHIDLYDVERHKNGDINTNGGIYNLITRTFAYKNKEGDYLCFTPMIEGNEFYVELKDLRTKELSDVYAEMLSYVTNFRFDMLVFNSDSMGFTGLLGDSMTEIRNHADQLIRECFVRFVEEIEVYAE